MKLPITQAHGLAALGLWTLAAVAAAAGQNAHLAGPGNERAAVPATRYEPLPTASPPLAPATSPPDNWKALNREVASFDSMSLTMDMEESKSAQPEVGGKHAQPLPAAGSVRMPAPAAPASAVRQVRTCRCISAIWSAVGTWPLPMAQSGS